MAEKIGVLSELLGERGKPFSLDIKGGSTKKAAAKPKAADKKKKSAVKKTVKKAEDKPVATPAPITPQEVRTDVPGIVEVGSEAGPEGSKVTQIKKYLKTSQRKEEPEADLEALKQAQKNIIENKIYRLQLLKKFSPEYSAEVDAAIAQLRGEPAPTPTPAVQKTPEVAPIPPAVEPKPQAEVSGPPTPTAKDWNADRVKSLLKSKKPEEAKKFVANEIQDNLMDYTTLGKGRGVFGPRTTAAFNAEMGKDPSFGESIAKKLGYKEGASTESIGMPKDEVAPTKENLPEFAKQMRDKVGKKDDVLSEVVPSLYGEKGLFASMPKGEPTPGVSLAGEASDPYGRYDTAKGQAAKDTASSYERYLSGLDSASRSKMVDQMIGALGKITAGTVGLGTGLDVAKNYQFEPTVDEGALRDVAKEKYGFEKGETERKLSVAQKGYEDFSKKVSDIMGRSPEETRLEELIATKTKGKTTTEIEPIIQQLRKEGEGGNSIADAFAKVLTGGNVLPQGAAGGASAGGGAGGGTKVPRKIKVLDENTAEKFDVIYNEYPNTDSNGRRQVYNKALNFYNKYPAIAHDVAYEILGLANAAHSPAFMLNPSTSDSVVRKKVLLSKVAEKAGGPITDPVILAIGKTARGNPPEQVSAIKLFPRAAEFTDVIAKIKQNLMNTDVGQRNLAYQELRSMLNTSPETTKVIADMILKGEITDTPMN
jgi:hypothetical protein